MTELTSAADISTDLATDSILPIRRGSVAGLLKVTMAELAAFFKLHTNQMIENRNAGVPALSAFTNTNFQAGTTATEVAGKALVLYTPANAKTQYCRKAAPSAPYRIAIRYDGTRTTNSPSTTACFGWRDSATGKLQQIFQQIGLGMQVQSWSNDISYAATVANVPFAVPLLGAWFGLRDDGTSIFFEISPDGVTWDTVYTVTKAAGYLGATGYNEVWFGTFAGQTITLAVKVWDESGLSRSYADL